MKKYTFHILILFSICTSGAYSQTVATEPVFDNVSTAGSLVSSSKLFVDIQQQAQAIEKMSSFIQEMKHKKAQYHSGERFLWFLYNQMYKKYLLNYQSFAPLSSTLTEGNYDCLSATSLFALVLGELDIHYSAYETNYHIYLKIKHQDAEILIETTDPQFGFVMGKKDIEYYESKYLADNKKPFVIGGNTAVSLSFNIHNSINIEQLAALQWYNQALACINGRQMEKAMIYIEKALSLYDCQRIRQVQEFATAWSGK